jgi:hypothetical protein
VGAPVFFALDTSNLTGSPNHFKFFYRHEKPAKTTPKTANNPHKHWIVAYPKTNHFSMRVKPRI